jgi:hypothetical protein
MPPHLGHLNARPNFRHFPHRLICISPQLGQRNFVASVPGGIGLPQLVHVTNDSVAAFSDIKLDHRDGSVNENSLICSMSSFSQVYYCSFLPILYGVVLGVNLRNIVPKMVVRLEDLSGKSIAIDAFYPGASAETVENSVTQIIEQKMTGFDDMLYLSGTSDSAGALALS